MEHQVAMIKEIVDAEILFELVGDRCALEQLIKQNEVNVFQILLWH